MSQTNIQQAYSKVETLMKEMPGHTSVVEAVRELKMVTDNQLLENFKMIYGEEWENTSAYKEFHNQIWREKLENNLLKRELGIDVSITKLILAATGALSEVLKETENHENKESSDMQAEALAEGEEENKGEEDGNGMSEKKETLEKYSNEKEKIISRIGKDLKGRFSLLATKDFNNYSIEIDGVSYSYEDLFIFFLGTDFRNKNGKKRIKKHIKLSKEFFPEETNNYIEKIKKHVIEHTQRNQLMVGEKARENFSITVEGESFSYRDLVIFFNADIKKEDYFSDAVYKKLSERILGPQWESLIKLFEIQNKEDSSGDDNKEKFAEEAADSASGESDGDAKINEIEKNESDTSHMGSVTPAAVTLQAGVPFPNEIPLTLDEVAKKVEEDLNNIGDNSSLKLIEPFLNQDDGGDHTEALSKGTRRHLLKEKVSELFDTNPELLKPLLTDEAFYKRDFDKNPVFIKHSALKALDKFSISENGTLYLKTTANLLGVYSGNKYVYGSAYEKVLEELIGKERLKEEREKLKNEIKEVLEARFKEDKDLEEVWFLPERTREIIANQRELKHYFSVEIKKGEILSTKDMSRWIGYPLHEAAKINFFDFLKKLYGEEDVKKRTEAIRESKIQETINEHNLLDFNGSGEEGDGTVVYFDDAGEPTLNIEDLLLEISGVEKREDFETLYEDQDDLVVLENIFLKAVRKIIETKMEIFGDPANEIEEGNKAFILEAFKKQYPYADASLDNFWEDKALFEKIKKDYFEEQIMFATGDFFGYPRVEGITLFEHLFAILYLFDDDNRYGDYLDFTIDEIDLAFRTSHNKALGIIQKEEEKRAKKQSFKSGKKSDKERAEEFGISLEEYKDIQKLISLFPCHWDAKKRKRATENFVHYMKSGEIFRLNDFCRNKQIKLENVPGIQLDELLRKLGIRINENDKIKERVEDEAKDEVKEIDQEGELSLEETFELPLTGKPIEISSEEVKKDIASNFINIAEYLGFGILNKKDLSKQIETYCTNTKDKDDLARLIVSPNFWHLNKKKTKENYYSIEVRRTGRRFLAKNIDGKFFITGFYKHDMYEKIINNKNKKMLKIRDS